MTQRDKDDLLRGLSFRKMAYMARRWPMVMRLFLDATLVMTDAPVHARKGTRAIELVQGDPSYTPAQRTQLAAMLHQLGDLIDPREEPAWWKGDRTSSGPRSTLTTRSGQARL